MEIRNLGNFGSSWVKPSLDLKFNDRIPTYEQVMQKDQVSISGSWGDTGISQLTQMSKNSETEETVSVMSQENKGLRRHAGIGDVPLMNRDLYVTDAETKGMKKVTFVYDPDGSKELLDNLKLVGSWDKNSGRWTTEWKNSEVPMQKDEKTGVWKATVNLLDEGQEWQWGVFADAPTGKNQWAVFTEGNLKAKLNPQEKEPVVSYAPTTYTRMGAVREGEDIGFKFWAPNAQNVIAKVWGDDPFQPTNIPMTREKDGTWNAKVEGGWKQFEGKNFCYEVTTSEGKKILRNDPYAREIQGQQRGIGILYLHPKSGEEVHQFHYENGKPTFERLARFEVQGHGDAKEVHLVLSDENGKPMSKEQIREKLGDFDSSVVEKFHNNKFNDFWDKNFIKDGHIQLTKQGNAWATILNNPDKLAGLQYRFEVHKTGKDGKTEIVGDINKDGTLDIREAKATAFNDPYSEVILGDFKSTRFGIIKEPTFEWKHDNAPRMASEKNKMIAYQFHIGSMFGDAKNVQRSNLKDIINHLEYFKELGVNTLECLPINAYEGLRDWGYMGTSTFAISDNYGFEDEKGQWVGGADAVKKFVDTAHEMGFNVINDVVYNHWGGEFNNMWEHDGNKNPYFSWQENPQVVDGKTSGIKHTDWGAMPAYNKEKVREFIVGHSLAQLNELHFDGLRFDFTHPIHAQGWGGDKEGWDMLRQINKTVHFFHPNAVTAAEEFPNAEIITTPVYGDGKGGTGFDAMWNTEFQHRLVNDHNNPSILQQAAKGWKTDMDKFMHHLIFHPGFTNHMNSVTVISNHDEVGNADRTINVARDFNTQGLPGQWQRNATRMTMATGMLAPGMPIFFQGEESMAKNPFRWGKPSTWDTGWNWKNMGPDINWQKVGYNQGKAEMMDRILNIPAGERDKSPEFKSLNADEQKLLNLLDSTPPENREEVKYDIMRKQHFTFSKDVIALRKSSPAFDGDAEVQRVYTHNDNSVMAFKRRKEGEEFLVIGSLAKVNHQDYNIPLDGGKWKLVFNSDADFYGGENYGSKFEVWGDQGTRFDIPKGGVLVYKRVG